MKKILLLTSILTFITFASFAQIHYIHTNGTNIVKTDADGSNANLTFITGGNTITDIFVDEANDLIYWVNSGDGTIGKGVFSTGVVTTQSYVTTGTNPNQMTISGNWIYYTHDDGSIGRADLATGNTTVDNTFLTGALTPEGIVVAGNLIYWANSANGTIGLGTTNGMVFTQSLYSGGNGITDLIGFNGKLYWLNTGTNTIGSDFSGTENQSFITGVTGNAIYIDTYQEKIFWEGSIGVADLDGTNVIGNILTIVPPNQGGGLHTDIPLGIDISGFNVAVTPPAVLNDCQGTTFIFETLVNFSAGLTDLNGDATFSAANGSIDDNNTSLRLTIPGSFSPGAYGIIVTITDPDGVTNSSGVTPISSSSTSMTFNLHTLLIYANTGIGAIMGSTSISNGATETYTSAVTVGYNANVIWEVNDVALEKLFLGGESSSPTSVTIAPGITVDATAEFDGSNDEAILTLVHTGGLGAFDFDIELTGGDCGNTFETFNIIGTILPIELKYFKGHAIGENIVLDWATATETNNHYFTIERSYEGRDFEEVERVIGASNSYVELTYSVKDAAFDRNAKQIYYRLKQTDYDGLFSYSDIISVNMEGNIGFDITSVFADQNTLSASISTTTEDEIESRIFNINGQIVHNGTHYVSEGSNKLNLDINDLPSGIYVLHLWNGIQYLTEKVVKP